MLRAPIEALQTVDGKVHGKSGRAVFGEWCGCVLGCFVAICGLQESHFIGALGSPMCVASSRVP